jgi:hypothetical protein
MEVTKDMSVWKHIMEHERETIDKEHLVSNAGNTGLTENWVPLYLMLWLSSFNQNSDAQGTTSLAELRYYVIHTSYYVTTLLSWWHE